MRFQRRCCSDEARIVPHVDELDVGSVDRLSDGAAAVATIYLVEGFERRPVPIQASSVVKPTASRVRPVLGGLHHVYQRAA